MKKLLLIALLMLALVVTAVACTGTQNPEETTAAAGEATTVAPETQAPETNAPETQAPETEAPETQDCECTTTAPADTETQAPETQAPETTEGEGTTADPAEPVWIADPEAIAGVAGSGAGIAGAELKTESGVDYVSITVNSGDPQFTVGSNLGTLPQYLAIAYRTTANVDGEMFIGTSNGPNGQNDHVVLPWTMFASADWSVMIIDLSTVANITDGNIGYFRLDPFRSQTDASLDIAFIGFFNTSAYAEDYYYAYMNTPVVLVNADQLSANAATGNQIATFDVAQKNGVKYAHLTANGGDPYFTVVNNAGVMPNYLAIAYRTNTAVQGQFFIGSGAGPNGQGDNFNLDWSENTGWTLMVVDITTLEVTSITDNNVNYLRFDFFAGDSAEGDYFDVAYIGFFKSEAAAMLYAQDFFAIPKWDANKDVVTHQSFDELRKVTDGQEAGGVFTPGQSAGWNYVADLSDGTVQALKYWGWIGAKGDLGTFGYQIDDDAAVFSADFSVEAEAAVVAAAAGTGADSASRFLINIDLAELTGKHTVKALYKDAEGNVVILNTFTVIMPAPAHTVQEIVLGERVSGGPFGNAKSFGQRFTVADGFLKNITVTNMATYADGNVNKWNVTIWAWDTDYATTVAGTPLYTVNGENHHDNQHFSVDVPGGLMISGDIYYEVTYLEGSAAFTGWTADGEVIEGIETYAGGALAEGTYASYIVIGIPSLVEDFVPVEHDYVSEGLVSYYSGTRNTRDGHDTDSAEWEDLVGGHDMAITKDDSNYFTEEGLRAASAKHMFPQAVVNTINGQAFTIEILLGDFVSLGANFNTFISSADDHFALFRRNSEDVLELKTLGNGRIKIRGGLELLQNSLITVVYTQGDACYIYVNGELCGQIETVTGSLSVGDLFIGHSDAAKAFDTTYRSIRFYNRALTAEEVAANAVVDGVLAAE